VSRIIATGFDLQLDHYYFFNDFSPSLARR
jgi:hypothetical protein